MKTTRTTKETTTKETYKGTCNFCHDEFDKSKMTQHLKHCKQRKAAIAAENTSAAQKTRLFHIVVEGRYLPMYWMHLEMPTDATLYDLDDFLRATWLECCDHLSEFRIGKDSYLSQTEDMAWDFGDPNEVSEEETDEDSEEDEPAMLKLAPDEGEAGQEVLAPEDMDAVLTELLSQLTAEFQTKAALTMAPPAEVEAKLKDLLVTKFAVPLTPEIEAEMGTLARVLQLGALFQPAFQQHSMDVELAEVLKVGLKFFHEYDFGSTTHLALRVVAEREGVETKDEDGDPLAVQVLARNEPPVIPCRVCGKPATKLFAGYYSVEDAAVCDEHATPNSDEYEDGFLPVVNSPRVGVCGYTGDQDYISDWDEMEEDDEEDEEYE